MAHRAAARARRTARAPAGHAEPGPASPAPRRAAFALRWPLSALLAWGGCWLVFRVVTALGLPAVPAMGAATLVGCAFGLKASTRWRGVFMSAGFPASFAASLGASVSGASLPGWGWLVPLALLVLLYPVRSWRDAPVFPTPVGGLVGLAREVPLTDGAAVLDAGCGLGDGLRELRREYPRARLTGLEWSWPLRWLCAWRQRNAEVRRADIWAADWAPYDLVYLFQRPESMPRAAAKAAGELRPGAWLASREFEVPTLEPQRWLEGADGRRVWLYRQPFTPRATPSVDTGHRTA